MVDANVWVDSFCAEHTESLAACAFIGQATETGALLFFPVHIAKDVLHVVQHELKRSVLAGGGALDEASVRAIGDAALAFVRNMTENATAVGADASELWLADKYLTLHRDYEDNLVLAACKRAQIDYLVTNNRKPLEHADLANDADSSFGRTWWRGYRLARTVCVAFGTSALRRPRIL